MIGVGADPIAHPPVDWFAVAPEIALFAAAIVIVLGRSLIRHDPRVHEASLLTAITGIAASGMFVGFQWAFVHGDGPYQAINGIDRDDRARLYRASRRAKAWRVGPGGVAQLVRARES